LFFCAASLISPREDEISAAKAAAGTCKVNGRGRIFRRICVSNITPPVQGSAHAPRCLHAVRLRGLACVSPTAPHTCTLFGCALNVEQSASKSRNKGRGSASYGGGGAAPASGVSGRWWACRAVWAWCFRVAYRRANAQTNGAACATILCARSNLGKGCAYRAASVGHLLTSSPLRSAVAHYSRESGLIENGTRFRNGISRMFFNNGRYRAPCVRLHRA